MRLCDLLDGLDYEIVLGDVTEEVKSIEYHSKNVIDGSAFFAIEGYFYKGSTFVEEAIRKGATSILMAKEGDTEEFFREIKDVIKRKNAKVTLIKVTDVRKALATMSAAFYNNPSEEMQVIGVTGTKGKTTTAFMIHHILEKAGIRTGLIGTVVSGYEGHYTASDATTPQAPQIQHLMKQMLEAGCKAVVMEVSSQGLKHSRVEGVDFNIGVLTNISEDHIGGFEHESFEEYIEAKSSLFDMAKRAVINGDCDMWERIVKNKELKQKIFFGRHSGYDYFYKDVTLIKESGILGSRFFIKDKEFVLNIPGRFNIENAMCAISVCRALGIPWEIIQEALKEVKIPGRTELVITDGFHVMVDYAHNGIALKSLLESLKEYNSGRLMLVFGCGGNRDRKRRFDMGRTAFDLADYIIVTSDNPRNEKQLDITKDITSEMDFCEKVILSIPDRKEAIKRAIRDGRKGDIIVIAGKGHETYQIIGNETKHFDDKEVVLCCGKEK